MTEPKRLKISELTPDRHNANKGTERGQYMVDHSLEQFGAGRSILLDKDGEVIAGNKTLQAYADLGYEDVIVIPTDGKTLVAVQRTDMDLDDPQTKARELAYADNRASEVGLAWDAEQILADMESGIDLEQFFMRDELDELLAELEQDTGGAGEDVGAQTDRAEELLAEWKVERGQVWQVGKHRVMCGDSTSAEDVARLMGGGKPRLMITDPPYGVEYDPSWRNEAAEKGLIAFASRREGEVANDDRVDWTDTWKLSPCDVAYVWHGGRHAGEVQSNLLNADFEVRCQIIWAKPRFVISRGHYHWQHEPCWYAVRKNENAGWSGDRTQSTLWEIPMQDDVDMKTHSTQKPVECMARPIRNHAGDVYDPFLGSGTTLVACEQTGRVGYGMEISEKYVAVTLQRLKDMGLEPRLAEMTV